MRPTSFFVALVLLGSVVPGGRAAYADDEVHCVNVHDLTISPGLSIQGSSGTFRETSGTMECRGPINGRTPTGVGSYQDRGRYGTNDPDTCQEGGEGEAVFSSIVPTADGDQVLTAAYTFTYGDLTSHPGAVSGEFRAEGVRGTFEATPLEGDCVITPLTRVRVKADFFFARSFFTR
jgi:hypothetical protein